MIIKFKGEQKEVANNLCLLDFLEEQDVNLYSSRIVYNGTILSESILSTYILKEDDYVDVIEFMVGG